MTDSLVMDAPAMIDQARRLEQLRGSLAERREKAVRMWKTHFPLYQDSQSSKVASSVGRFTKQLAEC